MIVTIRKLVRSMAMKLLQSTLLSRREYNDLAQLLKATYNEDILEHVRTNALGTGHRIPEGVVIFHRDPPELTEVQRFEMVRFARLLLLIELESYPEGISFDDFLGVATVIGAGLMNPNVEWRENLPHGEDLYERELLRKIDEEED